MWKCRNDRTVGVASLELYSNPPYPFSKPHSQPHWHEWTRFALPFTHTGCWSTRCPVTSAPRESRASSRLPPERIDRRGLKDVRDDLSYSVAPFLALAPRFPLIHGRVFCFVWQNVSLMNGARQSAGGIIYIRLLRTFTCTALESAIGCSSPAEGRNDRQKASCDSHGARSPEWRPFVCSECGNYLIPSASHAVLWKLIHQQTWPESGAQHRQWGKVESDW